MNNEWNGLSSFRDILSHGFRLARTRNIIISNGVIPPMEVDFSNLQLSEPNLNLSLRWYNRNMARIRVIKYPVGASGSHNNLITILDDAYIDSDSNEIISMNPMELFDVLGITQEFEVISIFGYYDINNQSGKLIDSFEKVKVEGESLDHLEIIHVDNLLSKIVKLESVIIGSDVRHVDSNTCEFHVLYNVNSLQDLPGAIRPNVVTPPQTPIDSANTQIGNMRMSADGLDMLRFIELSPDVARGWGIGVFDTQNNMTAVYPHYVFRRNSNDVYESDGGITFGFGIQVTPAGYNQYTWARELVNQYVPGGFNALLPNTIPIGGVSQVVPGSSPVPIEVINNILRQRITDYERIVNNFAYAHGIPLQQNEFDALVSFTWQHWDNWVVHNWNVARLIRNGPPFDLDFAQTAFGMHGGFIQERIGRGTIEWRMFANENWRE